MLASSVLFLMILPLSPGLEIDIDLDRVLTQVKPEFVSVTIDSGILSPPKWKTFDLR